MGSKRDRPSLSAIGGEQRKAIFMRLLMVFAALALAPVTALAEEQAAKDSASPEVVSGVYIAKDFTFHGGETLPEIRLAYTTIGTPHRNARGEIDNAVMLHHGTGGNGTNFLNPATRDTFFGPGKPFDAQNHYIILPDAIGHGTSSKPSDGKRMAFPHYSYRDMVEAEHRLLTEHLDVKNLKVAMGISMGCMVVFEWAVTYPDFIQKAIPMACYPAEVAGHNRLQRALAVEAIKSDPAWQGGDYTEQPVAGMRGMALLSALMRRNPLYDQAHFPTGAKADEMIEGVVAQAKKQTRDANDAIYQIDAYRGYDPLPELGKIQADILWINFADDLINPPGLGLAEEAVKNSSKIRFHLVPASEETYGHMTLIKPEFWLQEIEAFLAE
ncbi:MAG: alpha/beta fold hydrolase [Sphingobium sp.]